MMEVRRRHENPEEAARMAGSTRPCHGRETKKARLMCPAPFVPEPRDGIP